MDSLESTPQKNTFDASVCEKEYVVNDFSPRTPDDTICGQSTLNNFKDSTHFSPLIIEKEKHANSDVRCMIKCGSDQSLLKDSDKHPVTPKRKICV